MFQLIGLTTSKGHFNSLRCPPILFIWLGCLTVFVVSIGSAWADDLSINCSPDKILVTRAEVRKQNPQQHERSVFYPELNETFITNCFKNSYAIMFLKQEVDAQHKNVQNIKDDDHFRYRLYSILIMVFSATATLLLGLQAWHQWFSYIALIPTALVTILTGVTQLENPRDTFIKNLRFFADRELRKSGPFWAVLNTPEFF